MACHTMCYTWHSFTSHVKQFVTPDIPLYGILLYDILLYDILLYDISNKKAYHYTTFNSKLQESMYHYTSGLWPLSEPFHRRFKAILLLFIESHFINIVIPPLLVNCRGIYILVPPSKGLTSTERNTEEWIYQTTSQR